MMKRWHWFALALLAAPLVVTLIMVPRFTGSTQHAEAQQSPRLVLDMDVTNGTGPCNPVDANRSSTVGGPSYQIAVCLVDSLPSPQGEPAGFRFDLVYDDSLNQCVPAPCGPGDTYCLDGNPDANTGATVFSTPSLGDVGYDCSFSPGPVCDEDYLTGPGHGRAFILCFTVQTPALAVGPGIASPLALVRFKAVAAGLDTLTLENLVVLDPQERHTLNCFGAGTCASGTDAKSPRPTGVGGIVNLPPAAVAAASDAPSDGSGWSAGAYAALACGIAGAAAAVALGGWYARRRWLS